MIINDFYNKRKGNRFYQTDVIYSKSRLSNEEKINVMWDFTEAYKAHSNSHRAIREAACLEVQYPAMMLGVEANDLFVGRFDNFPIHFSPQITPLPDTGVGYAFREGYALALLEDSELSEEARQKLEQLIRFWRVRHTKQKLYDAMPEEETRYLPYRHYTKGPGCFYPLFRIAGIFLDYEKLLSLGLQGLIDELKSRQGSSDDKELYEGMIRSIRVVIETCYFYASLCDEMAAEEPDEKRQVELHEMTRICRKLATAAPQTFREALQLMYLYSSICGAREYGRMDDYLAEFYAADVQNGILTEEEAVRYLVSLWRLMISREHVTDDRIIIGGAGRKHPENADRVAMLCMKASGITKDIVPQLTLRMYRGMNPEVYQKALELIAAGTTFPILYNDDVNIPAMIRAFGVAPEDAREYLPLGCGEFTFNHQRICSPNSCINLLEVLSGTLHGGKEPMEGKTITPGSGDLTTFRSFEELWQAYLSNLEYFMELTAKQSAREYRLVGKECALNLLTPLYDDCLKKGKALLDGGIRGLDAAVEVYGLVNTSDSLLAIKELVFEKKLIPPQRMLDALDADFEGYEKERAMMLAVEKYGNDLEAPDAMMRRVHESASYLAMGQSGKNGLNRYLIVNINNNVNTLWGRFTPASPDGRKKGTPMSNGNNPSSGMDQNGLTAMVRSLLQARTDIHDGVVQNFKFSHEMFQGNPSRAQQILEVYFEQGGAQAMISVVGREELENARKHPEKYGNLIVRVGGFSARYVELDDDVQLEILERTLY